MAYALDVTSRPLAEVAGANCRRLRQRVEATQDDLARCARSVGLRWDAAKVARFERGEVAPTFATVLAVTLALQMVADDFIERHAGEQIDWEYEGLADLLVSEDDSYVELTDKLVVRPEVVRAVCQGRGWNTAAMTRDAYENVNAAVDALASVIVRQGLTEHRLAKRLDISPAHLADLSQRLWNRTFGEERDHRAGPDANRQKRGRISRELQAELEKALTDGNN